MADGNDREHFIRELIAALQENEKLTTAGTQLPPPFTSATSDQHHPSGGDGGGGESDSSKEGNDGNDDDDSVFTGFFQAAGSASAGGSFFPLTTSGDGNVVSVAAAEGYETLQFDFPQIADGQLQALAEFYHRNATVERTANGVAATATTMQQLPITTTLVEGIVYLTEKNAGSHASPATPAAAAEVVASRNSEASGLLAASVLLFALEYLLRNADQVCARALLGKLHVPSKESGLDYNAPDHSISPVLNKADRTEEEEYVEKYAAQEDPDDLSEVYEGEFPVPRVPFAATSIANGKPSPSLPYAAKPAQAAASVSFTEKLRFLASHTFSSTFSAISAAKWEEWGIDACLFSVIQMLVLGKRDGKEQEPQQDQLYGHPHGEWTRYLYILRDRILRFPNASPTGIRKLKELIQLLQPSASAGPKQWSKKRNTVVQDSDHTPAAEIQLPHHLVYRVLAELVVSKEFQQRSAQSAQRELATTIHDLLPLVIQETQRLGTQKQCTAQDLSLRTAADENDDLILILIQLVHFLLVASSSRRAAADTLQESGFLRALLTLVPADPSVAQETVTSKRFWFTPLLRLVVECALWSAEFAEYIVRVPKFASLLPIVKDEFPAEFAVLLVALYHHQLGEFAALKALLVPHTDDVGMWESFVSTALFPLSCASYLDSMKKVCVVLFVSKSVCYSVI